MKILGSRNL